MRRHVDLLGTLFVLWGALALVVSLSFVALGLGVATLVVGSQTEVTGARLTAGAVLSLFGALAVLGLAGGAAHLWLALGLRRLREWARILAIIVAIVDLFVPPLGTALGAYALWVLLQRDGRLLFEAPAP